MERTRSVSLHSRYNPRLEAERYIDSLSLNERIRFCILIEPGLGYLIPPLRKRLPGAKLIALHAAERGSLMNGCMRESMPEATLAPDAEWFLSDGIPVQDFLEGEIPDAEAEEIRMLEWRPAIAVYGASYLHLMEESAQFIKRADANARTVKNFGPKWFRNFFRNLHIINEVICLHPLLQPLLVTGAGPGLEDAISLIRSVPERRPFFILAVSSSVPALEAANIIPDMVISTDGGQWAAFHLYECCRGKKLPPCPLAAALTAVLPSQCAAWPVLPISDGSLWQNLILEELKIPFITLPQRGTVSAAALDLAFALAKNRIYIAGIDLGNHGIQSHARPYSFDRFLEEKTSRLSPFYSQTFSRSTVLNEGGSYGIYASWFKKHIASYPGKIYSLGKNNPLFGPDYTSLSFFMSSKNVSDRGYDPDFPVHFETATLDSGNNRSQMAIGILSRALQDPVYSGKLENEIGSLLFPGRTTPPGNELIQAIHSLFDSASHGIG